MGLAVDPLAKRASFISEHPVFRRLHLDEAEALARAVDVIRLPRRGVLWEVGGSRDRLYLIRSGVVKVHQPSDCGRALTLGFYGKGCVVGEEALLLGGASRTEAVGYVAAEVYALSAATLRAQGSRIGMGLARLVAERRGLLERRLSVLLFKNASARLASLLLELAGSFGVRDSRGVIVNLKLTHRELAALIGATRETVSFAILDLRKRGLIVTEGKRVVLLDRAGLRALLAA